MMGDFRKFLKIACERGRNIPKRLVVICGASQQALKSLLVTVCDPRMDRCIIDGIEADPQL